MTFNPAESIDFNGNTGPFIQYTYARIKSVFRKAEQSGVFPDTGEIRSAKPGPKEIELVKLLRKYPDLVAEAAETYTPALIANYCYDLSREFNQFYHDFSILGEENASLRNFRLLLSGVISRVLFSGMWLLGIDMPERM
jgi:arginyl-tRNA synthetase